MTQDLQYFAKELFKYSWARKAVLFAVLFTATRSVAFSLIASLVIIAANFIAQARQQKQLLVSNSHDKATQTNISEERFQDFVFSNNLQNRW